MNKITLILAGTALLGIHARAALLLNDDFNSYPDGSLVAPGRPWTHYSGTTPGQVDVVSGQVSLSRSETEDVTAALNGGPITTGSGTTLYTSFTVSLSALPSAAGNYFAHFRDTTNSFRDRIWASTANAAAGEFRLGVGNGSTADANSGQIATDLTLNTTYLVVTRYDVGAGQSTIWLNPTAETDPNGVTAIDATTPVDIYSFNFRQDTAMGILSVDDLKAGTTFAEVVPEPSTVGLLGLSALGLLARRFRRRESFGGETIHVSGASEP